MRDDGGVGDKGGGTDARPTAKPTAVRPTDQSPFVVAAAATCLSARSQGYETARPRDRSVTTTGQESAAATAVVHDLPTLCTQRQRRL
ncbi:unnamed protein product [Soboliphyme baturini]|uniref:Secreted protein n=1 Tax=Soboliphyme baturini TaxID=241478 RepID=A0A183IW30_9BILA|nr:unnamed protein product [Soboliphyme baturini]